MALHVRMHIFDARATSTAHYIRKQLSVVVNGSFCPLRETPRPERRDVENNHDEREKIHSHRNANPDVHCTNTNQPNLSRLAVPDKKRICNFQEANKYSCNWEQVFPFYEYLRIDNVERRADESAPHTRAIPPSGAEAFR